MPSHGLTIVLPPIRKQWQGANVVERLPLVDNRMRPYDAYPFSLNPSGFATGAIRRGIRGMEGLRQRVLPRKTGLRSRVGSDERPSRHGLRAPPAV